MSTLYARYKREIKNIWDWNHVVESAKNNVQNDMDGNQVGYFYLGSLINPSGKYYLPFACSNVESCPQCKGRGVLSNKHYNAWELNQARSKRGELTRIHMNEYGLFSEWPIESQEHAHRLDRLIAHYSEKIECNRCGGLGSYEAYQDQEYFQALDSVAESFGGWIESGEGDPCDSFFCIAVDNLETGDNDDLYELEFNND